MEFRSVVCGVDPSPAGGIAAVRAARLVTRAGRLTFVGVDEIAVAGGAMGPGTVIVPHAGDARKAVDAAVAAIAASHENTKSVVLEGMTARALIETIEQSHGDLVVVGTHETRRLAGILLGSTATFILHDAPCSVLVAREGGADPWPSSIVVGVDGSDHAAEAYGAARDLATRFGASLRAIACVKELAPEALERVRALGGPVDESDYEPVDALVAASRTADLVVVGTRSLKGIRALGSVSERVAHEASCSVLVVRSAP
jgi:nucleotide-binding universal stress UspA family protein